MGPSSVREAFVEEIMEETVPELKFINGGTTGGSIHVFDAMVELLEQSKVNPYIIVLGLNARMLISRKINFNGNGYTDFLDYSNGREIVNAEISSFANDADRELLINSFWPWHRLSRQLGRLIRVGLFHLHKKLYWNKQLDRNDFSLIKRELRPMPKFRYKDKNPFSSEKFDAVLKKYEEEGMFDSSNYAKPQHMESLRQVLESSMKLSQNVVVVLMPEHSYGRENISPFAKAPLLSLLKDYEEKRINFLDLANIIPDSGLRDMGHLLPSSRTEFSRLVAQELNILIKGSGRK